MVLLSLPEFLARLRELYARQRETGQVLRIVQKRFQGRKVAMWKRRPKRHPEGLTSVAEEPRCLIRVSENLLNFKKTDELQTQQQKSLGTQKSKTKGVKQKKVKRGLRTKISTLLSQNEMEQFAKGLENILRLHIESSTEKPSLSQATRKKKKQRAKVGSTVEEVDEIAKS